MILPSDDDSRKPGDDEPPWGGQPGDPKRPHKGDDASPADDDEEEDDDEDDDDEEFDDSILFQDDEPDAASFPGDMTAEGSGIKAPAPPGWREELREELDECIDELAEIEDPSQDFDPPDPPDLFTFYGELAALRNELRRAFRRSAETAEKFGGALQSLAAHATDTPASLSHSSPWRTASPTSRLTLLSPPHSKPPSPPQASPASPPQGSPSTPPP